MMIAYHLRDCRERRCGRAETGAAARDEHERVLQVRITGVLMRADFCPTLVTRVYLSYKSRLPDRDLKERKLPISLAPSWFWGHNFVRCAGLYIQHVLQADRDCDLDFLVGASGSVVERESH